MRFISLLVLSMSVLLLGVGCPTSNPEYGAIPLAGEWSFVLSGNGSDLTCPIGAGGFSSTGSVDLSVSTTGNAVTLLIDGQVLVFYEQVGAGRVYQTGTRYFPVGEDGTGSVFFEFVANTNDSIVGTLNWDNQTDCTGAYPFTMVLVTPEAPGDVIVEPYSLEEGNWNAEFDEVIDDCEGTITAFTNFPGEVAIENTYDFDTGAPDPNEVFMSPPGVSLQRVGNTNSYIPAGGPFDLGTPIDEAGDLLLDFASTPVTGTLDLTTNGNGTAQGTLYFTSSACSGTAIISLSR